MPFLYLIVVAFFHLNRRDPTKQIMADASGNPLPVDSQAQAQSQSQPQSAVSNTNETKLPWKHTEYNAQNSPIQIDLD